MKLLSINADVKTIKGIGAGYLTGILYLAPADTAGLGNICPHATIGCRADCLFTAGRASIFPAIITARIERTRMFFAGRRAFREQLEREISALVKSAARQGLRPVVRLNGTSDLRFSDIFPGLMESFPRVRFYDYTKDAGKVRAWIAGKLPANYHLTFSLSESVAAQDAAREFLAAGVNVAVVFRSAAFPASFMESRIINGDANDLRFLDRQRGRIVGLKAKGKARRNVSGFVHDAIPAPILAVSSARKVAA